MAIFTKKLFDDLFFLYDETQSIPDEIMKYLV